MTSDNKGKPGRKRTRIDGRQVCFWLDNETIETIDQIAVALHQTRGAVVTAAVRSYGGEAEDVKKLTSKTLAKIRKLVDDD